MKFTHPTGLADKQGYSYWPAPAKLNLELRILAQRSDGYHELQTLFQLLDIGDELKIKTNPDGIIKLISDFNNTVPAQDNIIVQAATELQKLGSPSSPTLGATIVLNKNMPSGAGLGAGSSDAATTLIALNHLWGLNLSCEQLSELGKKLGADVPVFIQGQSAWAEGIGEILSPVNLPKKHYLIIYPDCSINTKQIFSHPALTRNDKPIKLRASRCKGSNSQAEFEQDTHPNWTGYNAFQSLVRDLYPEVNEALNFMNQYGEATLTGTGSCVFLTFDNEREVRKISALCKQRWLTLEAVGINTSPLLNKY